MPHTIYPSPLNGLDDWSHRNMLQTVLQRIQVSKTIHVIRLQNSLLIPFIPCCDKEPICRNIAIPVRGHGCKTAANPIPELRR
mmetsp:Transcript_29837/g.81946  ORF Transcript_29837/g.81946 Transcript_29837/m.81946 type:complete len:83 (+) Transcript_29837:491-739(+)